MTSILRVTDGITFIELATGEVGFRLERWRPGKPGFKDGGVWRDSPLADGRRLADYRFESVIDTWQVHLTGQNMDRVIEAAQEMDRLLLKAVNYWTTAWQQRPVYLIARGSDETNTRYAVVYGYEWAEMANPHAQPFYAAFGLNAMDNLTISIEHGLWLETPPGEGTAVERSNDYEYEGHTYGPTPVGANHSIAPVAILILLTLVDRAAGTYMYSLLESMTIQSPR